MSTVRPDESIQTDRLDLRPVTVEDADELAAIFADRQLYTFTGGDPSTLEALRSTFARLADAHAASASAQLNWVVRHRSDDRAIGMLQAIFTDGGHTAEIAWVIGVPWQGQGLAKEAACAVVAWLDAQGVRSITAWIRPDHHASVAVAPSSWPYVNRGVPRHRATSRAAMAPPVAEPLGHIGDQESAWAAPASGPRGGSLVLPPRPGWRDLAGRCWHADPSRKHSTNQPGS